MDEARSLASAPTLLSPLTIGPVVLPNRCVSTAHQTSLVEDGLPTPAFVAYHAARADGGVGLIVLEALAVHPSGALSAKSIRGYDVQVVERLRQVAQAVQRPGGRLFAQLFHGGRENWGEAPRAPVVAPSAVPSSRFATEPRALTPPEVEEIVAGYELVAAHCRAAGLDGVELCASHGYLPSQFLSARTNQRGDSWGTDRTAFLVAALRAMRRGAGPSLAVGIRLSLDEQHPAGRGLDASIAVLAELDDAGLIDYASCVTGDSAEHRSAAYIVPPPPTPSTIMTEAATAARARLRVPVISTTRIHDVDQAEHLLRSGAADAVGMTRALIAEPTLPRLVAAGVADRAIACIGCNLCIARYHLGQPIRCLQNERTGNEADPPLDFDATGRRVAVVGAGPAGLAAAETAGLAGAEVMLFERERQIGGQLVIAGSAPAWRESAARFVRDRMRRLQDAGVTLVLRTEVTRHTIGSLRADTIIVATGARPYVPLTRFPGFEVVDAWSALRDTSRIAQCGPALIADWGGGSDGLDAAEVLAGAGCEVTLAVASHTVGATVHQYARAMYLERLERLGVALLPYRSIDAVAGQVVLRSIWTGACEPLPPEIRTIVLAQGRRPDDALAHELGAAGYEAFVAGDCCGPRTAQEAVLEGAAAARRALAASGSPAFTLAQSEPHA